MVNGVLTCQGKYHTLVALPYFAADLHQVSDENKADRAMRR